MSHYTLSNIDFQASRTELHDLLGLTGAEISFNVLPAGVSVPFVHAHAHNEEIYIVLEGAGKLYIDGEELSLKAGDCFRIAPEGERCISAAEDIGREKIPRRLRARFGESLEVTIVSGTDFPEDLTPYDLVIHCGACMFNRTYMMSRVKRAKEQGVPMCNYGVALDKLTGILDKVEHA